MGLYVNQKQIRILVILSIVAIAAFLCGCTGTKDDNSSEGSVNTELLGTWSMIEEAENSSLKIIYTFYSNFSFFSGVQNMSSKLYDFSLWGSYSLSDSRINLIVSEQNLTSNLKYTVSDDGNNLSLYYEDDINFDILTREQ